MLHKNIVPADVHVPYAWLYADAAARTAATGFTSADIGKLCRQADTNALYMLIDTAPVWSATSAGGYTLPTASTTVLGGVKVDGTTITINPTTGVITATAGGGAALTVKDEGTSLSTAVTTLDFVGAGVTATNVGGVVTVTIPNSGGTAVETATHAATAKATPVDADELPLADSAASWGLKKLTWAAVKSTLKSYFDTVYQAASANLLSWAALAPAAKQDALVSGTSIKTVNGNSLLGSGDLTIAGGGSSLTVKDEGTNLTTAATSIDFVGSGVTATNTGGAVTVTIAAGGGTAVEVATHAATAKTTLSTTDELPIVDSGASWGLKKTTMLTLSKGVASAHNAAPRTSLANLDCMLVFESSSSLPAAITLNDFLTSHVTPSLNLNWWSYLNTNAAAVSTLADTDVFAVLTPTSPASPQKITWANTKTLLNALYQPKVANLTSWAALAPSAKQDALVSGTNIKTVNSTSLLGSGDVAVQATLVSGTNIKTVNGASVLGAGNIDTAAKTVVALGNSGTTAQALNYSNGQVFTLTVTGAFTLSLSNLPASYSEMQLKLTNGGAYVVTLGTTITFIRADTGAETTSLATYLSSLGTGRTALKSSGDDQFVFWSYNGSTVYGKLI